MNVIDKLIARPNNFPFRRLIWKYWYNHLASKYENINIRLMNYGYVEQTNAQELKLDICDEAERYCIQLYHHVANAILLTESEVLEVGCGRGGGAYYVKSYLNPRSLTGIDFSRSNIDFCRQKYQLPGLNFELGDAEALQFADNTFDTVINVESSHCYQQTERFFTEVYRVLRRDGKFLFTDFRPKEAVAATRKQLQNAGFSILKEENITANVCASMELEHQRKIGIIDRQVPYIFRGLAGYFAAAKGTPMYEGLKTGELEYLCYVLKKQPSSISNNMRQHRSRLPETAEV
ncbi:class I SAM-dependent methyltransferase [Pleurocapsales cyanobacterium LEGE 10410]|nr:class I SAM-dependent methyltransferase [Pleurocapsales cyanobacterium LEGE 10410]